MDRADDIGGEGPGFEGRGFLDIGVDAGGGEEHVVDVEGVFVLLEGDGEGAEEDEIDEALGLAVGEGLWGRVAEVAGAEILLDGGVA